MIQIARSGVDGRPSRMTISDEFCYEKAVGIFTYVHLSIVGLFVTT